MKQIQVEPFPGQRRKFLYHKTDAGTGMGKISETFQGHSIPGKDFEKWNDMPFLDEQADILSGDTFWFRALKKFATTEYFSILAIMPDSPDGHSGTHMTNSRVFPVLRNVLDTICQSYTGFWGIYGISFMACFPGTKASANKGLQIAEEIRKKLDIYGNETVTIGIAYYPQLVFKKEDIVKNACKALEHAFFLGSNSTVQFDSVSLNISGDKLYQQDDIDGAITEFELALLLDEKNVNVINSLGVCFGVKNEHSKAIDMFEKAMGIAPDDVMAPYNAGLTYLMTGDSKKAKEFFLKAYALDPNQFEVLIQLGRMYLENKDFKKSIEYLEKTIAIDEESGPAHRFLGECYSEMNIYDKAIEFYSKAIKINANDAYSLSALACLYTQLGINRDIAVVFGKQSVDLSPGNPLFRQQLGTVYYRLEMFEEALNEFKYATELGNDCQSFILEIENRLSARPTVSGHH